MMSVENAGEILKKFYAAVVKRDIAAARSANSLNGLQAMQSSFQKKWSAVTGILPIG